MLDEKFDRVFEAANIVVIIEAVLLRESTPGAYISKWYFLLTHGLRKKWRLCDPAYVIFDVLVVMKSCKVLNCRK